MPAPHLTGTAGERQATVSDLLIPEFDSLRPEWVLQNSGKPERILSALGHPGYGRQYAARVLDIMARTGQTTWEVIYGR
jgi:hypothetical protein